VTSKRESEIAHCFPRVRLAVDDVIGCIQRTQQLSERSGIIACDWSINFT